VDHKTLEDGSIISDIGQPTALGGISMGVKNVEITAAYASIANKGTYIEPTYFTKILDSQGNVLLEKNPSTKQVLKEQTAYLLTSAMQDVMTRGTGASAGLANMPCAGKTGTTSENYDIWLCAYTPYYTCSVWGGYDVNTSLSNTSFHLAIWRSIMTRIHENLPVKNFTMPSGLVSANICKKCGKLAVAGLCDMDPRGSMVVTELFTEGTEPTESCTCHVDSGGLIYQVLPEGASGGTDDDPYLINSPYYIDEDGYYHYTDAEGNQMIAPPGSYEVVQRRNPEYPYLNPRDDETNPGYNNGNAGGGNRGNTNGNNTNGNNTNGNNTNGNNNGNNVGNN
jgi:penicillin-binding protein 1A